MGKPIEDTPTFIQTPKGDELVLMTRATYDRLLGAVGTKAKASTGAWADDADDDLVRRLRGEWEEAGRPSVPLAVVRRVRAGDSYLKALRAHKGMTQGELAEKAGIRQGYLSEIESDRKTPTEEVRSKLAAALDVHPLFLSDAAPKPAASA